MKNIQTAKYDDVTVSAITDLSLSAQQGRVQYKSSVHLLRLAAFGGPNKYADAVNNLGLNNLGQRTYIQTEESNVGFESVAENIENNGDSFSFSQQFTIEIIKAPKNDFSITDEFSIRGSIYARTSNTTVRIVNTGTAYTIVQGRYTVDSTGGTGEYVEEPGAPIKVNYDIKRPITRDDPPVCEEAKCEEDHIVFALDTNILELRCPKTSLTIVNNTVENLNRGGEPQQACVYPNWTVLKLTFSGINRAKKDLFNQFIRDTAGLMITYTDCCGDIWEGAIISNEIPIEQDGNGYECPEGSGSYTFSFDFEGTKTGSIYP